MQDKKVGCDTALFYCPYYNGNDFFNSLEKGVLWNKAPQLHFHANEEEPEDGF